MISQDIISFTQMLKTTAEAFRLGMEGRASENLIKLIDLLAPLVQDPAWPNRKEMNSLLAELLDAQSRKDYLYAADLLEYRMTEWFMPGEKASA